MVLTGIRLSLYGDALGERTGLGSGLVGLVFLAAVTSLPELVVSITSVIQNADPVRGADLAVGNMLGSNLFNLLILALAVLVLGRAFDPSKLESPHTGSTVYGLLLLAFFAAAFFAAGFSGSTLPLLRCGWGVVLLPVVYGFCLHREHRKLSQAAPDEALPSGEVLAHLGPVRFYSVLTLLCGLIIGGGIMLSILGSRMALPPEQGGFGLEASLIGTLFLAVSTSLPELVISFSSVRMGFLDMSVGNVLGSNMFNLLIIFAADVAQRNSSLLHDASPVHWISAGQIVVLTGLAALLLRSRSRTATAAIAVLMLAVYIAVLIAQA